MRLELYSEGHMEILHESFSGFRFVPRVFTLAYFNVGSFEDGEEEALSHINTVVDVYF